MRTTSKTGIKSLARVREGLLTGNWGSGFIDVDDWLIRACWGTKAIPAEVLEKLMAPEDIEDLRNGDLPYESLKCFIRVWCDMGKPKQN